MTMMGGGDRIVNRDFRSRLLRRRRRRRLLRPRAPVGSFVVLDARETAILLDDGGGGSFCVIRVCRTLLLCRCRCCFFFSFLNYVPQLCFYRTNTVYAAGGYPTLYTVCNTAEQRIIGGPTQRRQCYFGTHSPACAHLSLRVTDDDDGDTESVSKKQRRTIVEYNRRRRRNILVRNSENKTEMNGFLFLWGGRFFFNTRTVGVHATK